MAGQAGGQGFVVDMIPKRIHNAFMEKAKPKVSASWLREVAVAAKCDPRTVAKFMAGKQKVSAMVKERIVAVLKAQSLEGCMR